MSDSIMSDRPLEDPQYDRLGYANFARNIANSIEKMFNPNGFVIAINSPWGSGKTSFLNFIDYYLCENCSGKIIIRFNPWNFSGRDDLTRQFFEHLGFGLSKNLKNATKILKLISRYLASFAAPGFNLKNGVNSIFDFIEEKYNPDMKDIETLKNEIAEELKKENKKIIIIVDDIDRLNPQEIMQVFQVVKIIADFPNVVYLLAFDKAIVRSIMKNVLGKEYGENYLQKIIQASFDLPPPTPNSIYNLFYEKVDGIVNINSDILFEEERWLKLYENGLNFYIKTPRDAVRIVNNLMVTYPPVKGEVNPVDFIGIETIRIFEPGIYNAIKRNPSYFIGVPGSVWESEKKSNIEYFDKLVGEIKDEQKGPIKFLITFLFPRLTDFVDNDIGFLVLPEMLHTYRQKYRICDRSYFPTYIWMTIPDIIVSNREFQEIRKSIKSRSELKNNLSDLLKCGLSGLSQINNLFSRFEDIAVDLSEVHLINISSVIFDIGDEYFEISEKYSNTYYLTGTLRILLSNIDKSKRFEILNELISNSNSIYTSVSFEISMTEFSANFEERLPYSKLFTSLFDQTQLERFKKTIVNKIITMSSSGKLMDCLHFHLILEKWMEWDENHSNYEKWIKSFIHDDQLIGEFLSKMKTSSSSLTNNNFNFDMCRLKSLFDVEEVENIVYSILSDEKRKSKISFEHLSTIKLFDEDYNCFLKNNWI